MLARKDNQEFLRFLANDILVCFHHICLGDLQLFEGGVRVVDGRRMKKKRSQSTSGVFLESLVSLTIVVPSCGGREPGIRRDSLADP